MENEEGDFECNDLDNIHLKNVSISKNNDKEQLFQLSNIFLEKLKVVSNKYYILEKVHKAYVERSNGCEKCKNETIKMKYP